MMPDPDGAEVQFGEVAFFLGGLDGADEEFGWDEGGDAEGVDTFEEGGSTG